jgi:ABC-type bacteriocin/lantibiotic exporter with double-glycine peptidase domain
MKHLLMFQLLTCICYATSCFAAEPVGTNVTNSQPLCGASCVYVALNALDVNVTSFESLLERLPEVAMAGHSLGDLAKVAQSYEMKTLAVETTLENLERRSERFACVAHINEAHFVLISNIGAGHVTLMDPPYEKTIDRDVFSNSWNGKALLISAGDLVPEDKLGGRFPEAVLCVIIVVCAVGGSFHLLKHNRT